MIRDIAGRQNHSVKLARKLQKKKYRRERGLLVCEGLDLLLAAWASRADIREILVRRELLAELPEALVALARHERPAGEAGPDIGVCDSDTLEYASSLGGGTDVVFICAEPAWSLSDLALKEGFVFFLAGVGDPGNVGTIVRSMVAFGGKGLICSPGTADPFSPKAMRAGMGAQFQLPVVVEVTADDLAAWTAGAAQRGACVPRVVVADPREGEELRDFQATGAVCVVLGAERTGPGSEWERSPRITIRQCEFDSLNVAMAGTIIAYELGRCSSESLQTRAGVKC